MFLHKICVNMGDRRFQRAMIGQERCLSSGDTEQGGKVSDPGGRWRDEQHLIANTCWERPSAAEGQKG